MNEVPDSLRARYRSGWSDREVALFGVAVSLGTLTAVAASVLVVGPLVAYWIFWIIPEQSDPAVSSRLMTSEIVDDHSATAVVRVQWGDDPVDAECSVRAIAADKTIVGQQTFVPDTDAGPDYEVEIATERRATAVENIGCTAEGQPRPR